MTTRSSSDAEAVEHHVEVTRAARYWTLGSVEAADEVWFVLHGYRQLARRFLSRFESVTEPGRLIVAPEALSRFYVSSEPRRHGPESVVGASWMTREDRVNEIRDYVAYLDRLAEELLTSRSVVTVLGFSQGGAAAARWVSMGRVSAATLVLWGSFLPHDQDWERASELFSQTELVLARGDSDPALTVELAERERTELERAGVRYRTVRYTGGHEIDAETLRALAGAPRRRQ